MKNTLMKLGTAIGRWLLLAAAPTILLAGCSDDDEAVAVTELRLNKPTLALQIGATERLTATVLPADAEDKTVTWTSSDPAVATVDATGLVSAVAAGTTTVTAQSGGKSATCTVTVSKIPVERVVLSKTSLSLSLEQSEQLAATVTPDDATDRQVTWTSSDEQIATVSAEGLVTAVRAGTATVTATAGGVASDCAVRVEPDIYFSGRKNGYCTVWKNGTVFFQSTQSGTITTRVLVDNGDIFYAGYEQGNRCKVWKNGEVLYELTIGASITSIAYWNGDIYTAGYEKDAETQNTIATVWKNDRPYHLTDGSTNAFARSVAVSKEGVVHVVGYQFNNNNTAIHWIDGVPTYLSESPRSGVAWEIALADGDVYITGQISNKAVLWKNDGEPKSLASDLYSNGKSLAIENGNVYVLGSDRISSTSSNNAAAIWKNDEPVKIISSGDNGVDPYSVAVWNGDVYAVGRYSDDRYVWWKNDVETEFNYPEDQYQPGVFNISIYTGPAR